MIAVEAKAAAFSICQIVAKPTGAIVRLELHDSLGANKAKDLMVAIRKVIRHYNAP
ncbi:MAG: hypothetical protein WA884_01755 [Methyloceanibacter sp.]